MIILERVLEKWDKRDSPEEFHLLGYKAVYSTYISKKHVISIFRARE
jgi:hypothetical protein